MSHIYNGIDAPNDCLHLLNLYTINNLDLRPLRDSSFLFKSGSRHFGKGKSHSSMLFKALGNNFSSDKSSSDNSNSINKRENPEDSKGIINGIMKMLYFKEDSKIRKIEVPSILKKDSSRSDEWSLQSNFPELDLDSLSILKKGADSSSLHTITTNTTLRRRVKDINWPS